jgi:hypothetical protein
VLTVHRERIGFYRLFGRQIGAPLIRIVGVAERTVLVFAIGGLALTFAVMGFGVSVLAAGCLGFTSVTSVTSVSRFTSVNFIDTARIFGTILRSAIAVGVRRVLYVDGAAGRLL